MTRTTRIARRPTLLSRLAAVTAVGFLGSGAHARRRNPLHESVFENSPLEGVHRRIDEDREGEELVRGTTTTTTTTSTTRRTIGTNAKVPFANSPDDHLVKNMPLLDEKDFPGDHWAGLLPVNDEGDGYLFYWLFAPDPEAIRTAKQEGIVNDDESNVPLLLWLNGGPACSSMDGLWLENGPFRLRPGANSADDGHWNNIEVDPHSWHNAPAYTLYVDQPVGTGLAFTTSGNYPRNDEMVNADFHHFLTEFMKLHNETLGVDSDSSSGDLPTLQRPFFFSGESHAGHYIPSMMNYIRQKNVDTKWLTQNNGVVMPLSGAAIGNGWFDPIYQYSAHEAGYGYGLIGKAQERALAEKEERCRNDLRRQNYVSDTCFGLLQDVVSNSLGKNNAAVVSQYDQRVREKRNKKREFPIGHHDVEAYLGQLFTITNADVQDVLAAIHAGPSWDSGQRYRECTDPPYRALAHQDGLGVVPDIVDLLENHDNGQVIRLLFFNGIHDLICNHVGNENALEHLPWKHRHEYVEAARYGWEAPSTGQLAGYAKEYENLTFLKVLDSGHMVPMDVPSIALDMMVAFMYGTGSGTFNTYQQKVPTSDVGTDPIGGEEPCPVCPACPSGDGDDDDEGCPVCEEPSPSESSCTKQECLEDFDLHDVEDETFLLNDDDDKNANVSPMYMGIVSGISTFLLLAVMVRYCCPWALRPGTRQRHNKSQVEMTDSPNGAYRDEGSFDDELAGGNHND